MCLQRNPFDLQFDYSNDTLTFFLYWSSLYSCIIFSKIFNSLSYIRRLNIQFNYHRCENVQFFFFFGVKGKRDDGSLRNYFICTRSFKTAIVSLISPCSPAKWAKLVSLDYLCHANCWRKLGRRQLQLEKQFGGWQSSDSKRVPR